MRTQIHPWSSLLALVLLTLTGTASAQDLDANAGDARRSARNARPDKVREVARGYYIKANVGTSYYFGPVGSLLRPVIGLGLSVGSDVVDTERLSVAWEVLFGQSLHNGPKFDDLASIPPTLQGDVHTFYGAGVAEVSFYPGKRLGLGLRAGGGVMVVPLLMERAHYEEDVVQSAWGGVPGSVHGRPLPMILAGPTLEYYTKLSHFSVGADVDGTYVIGLDPGLLASGYLKYTF